MTYYGFEWMVVRIDGNLDFLVDVRIKLFFFSKQGMAAYDCY
jgi:hypothetical protein